MARAVAAYQIKLAKGPYQQRRGARTICSDFQQLYYNETGKSVKLSHSTLIRLAAGGMTKTQSNARLAVSAVRRISREYYHYCYNLCRWYFDSTFCDFQREWLSRQMEAE